jgi:hypothetical protein
VLISLRAWVPTLLLLGVGAAAFKYTGDKPAPTPYRFLYDRSQATDTQQRFLNTVVADSGIPQEELQPLVPKIKNLPQDLPILLEMHRASERPMVQLVELRRSGLTWLEMMQKLKMPLKPLFEDVNGKMPSPYKEAWMEFRMKYRPDLGDDQIHDLMLLQMAHRISGRSVEDLVKAQTKGHPPETILAMGIPSDKPSPEEKKAKDDDKAKPRRPAHTRKAA